MTMHRMYVTLCCLLLVLSCACGEKPKDFVPVLPNQKIHTFSYSYDAVWSGLLTLLEKQDIDLETIDKELGSIITDFIPVDPRSTLGKEVLFPEKGERVIEKAKYDMVLVVKKVDENRTSVQAEVHLSKYSRSLMTYYSWRDQLSNGYIEKRLFNDLEKILKVK